MLFSSRSTMGWPVDPSLNGGGASPAPPINFTPSERAIEVADAMDEAERKELRELVSKDRFPLNAMNALQHDYQLTEVESLIALDRICGR